MRSNGTEVISEDEAEPALTASGQVGFAFGIVAGHFDTELFTVGDFGAAPDGQHPGHLKK